MSPNRLQIASIIYDELHQKQGVCSFLGTPKDEEDFQSVGLDGEMNLLKVADRIIKECL